MKNSPSNAEQVVHLVAKLQARLGVEPTGYGKADATPLRYVIYARKSTDTAEKQERRSIGDQIYECKTLADRLGLRFKDIIHEEKSAIMKYKKPPAEASGFLVTYCTQNRNMLVSNLKRWSTAIGVITA